MRCGKDARSVLLRKQRRGAAHGLGGGSRAILCKPCCHEPEAPLMARQQFVAHPFRVHSGPSLAAVRECANSLIADEPCDLRDRKVALTEIEHGEIGAELIENFTEAQAFRRQPSRQRPATHA